MAIVTQPIDELIPLTQVVFNILRTLADGKKYSYAIVLEI